MKLQYTDYIDQYVEGDLSPEERLVFEAMLIDNAQLREEYALRMAVDGYLEMNALQREMENAPDYEEAGRLAEEAVREFFDSPQSSVGSGQQGEGSPQSSVFSGQQGESSRQEDSKKGDDLSSDAGSQQLNSSTAQQPTVQPPIAPQPITNTVSTSLICPRLAAWYPTLIGSTRANSCSERVVLLKTLV